MDPVSEAQFRMMQRAFSQQGVQIELERRADGEIDYIYERGRLLAPDRGDNIEAIQAALPGTSRTHESLPGDLVVLDLGGASPAFSSAPEEMTVPEALSVLSTRIGPGPPPVATPNHVLHLTRLCPATEPEVPAGQNPAPWPPPCGCGEAASDPVLVVVIDTGLVPDASTDHAWMTKVAGDPDDPGRLLASGRHSIDGYTGHGTFVAGVVTCMAPSARVVVENLFSTGGALESQVAAALDRVMAEYAPHLISLSAGAYTYADQQLLGLENFHATYPDVVLVAAAGNDNTDLPFHPAALPWVVSVGALGADQAHRAWFSNFGPNAKVYALGEGLVNAFATGEYTYDEPPRVGAVQTFTGMARWSGTSFSTPLVAGLIASRMARTGETAEQAAQAIKGTATMQSISGLGPVLHPCDQP